MNDEEKEKALDKLVKLDNEFNAYESSIRHLIDERSAKREAELRIRKAEEGIRKEKEKIVRRCIKMGMDLKTIAWAAELPMERKMEINNTVQ